MEKEKTQIKGQAPRHRKEDDKDPWGVVIIGLICFAAVVWVTIAVAGAGR